jgi:UDP-N-acetylmuramoyl-tripeptide--D-alanyl-D-alanine ligase
MIAAVLSERFSTYSTEGNHNSLVGMPMSVMEIPKTSEYAVLEMGMSGFGEIERLSSVAEPEIAVITNIGTSHMELLGSRENICRAKLEILSGLQKGGVLLLNGDEPLLRDIGGKSYRTQYVSLTREDCAVFAQNIRVSVDRTTFDCVCDGKRYSDLAVPKRLLSRWNHDP